MRALIGVALVLCSGLFSCSSVFYYPSRQLYSLPSQFGLQSKEITFETPPAEDKEHASDPKKKLYGWYLPTATHPPKGTIIQFHGNGENMSSHYITLAWMVRAGYDLFIFDYQGYGKSEGDPSEEGTYWDGLAALDEAWKLHEKSGAKRFIVYGQSLGGAIAARSVADFAEKDHVSLLVQDSTFYSYKTVARRVLASHWITWPFSPLGWLLVSNSYSSHDAIRDGKIPILVIHDEKDETVPLSCGEDIFELAGAKKDFWKLQQGIHTGVFADPKSPYRQKFLDYLDAL